MPKSADVSVSARLLSILAAFEGSNRPLTVSEIAEKTGLATSTTYRMVGDLEAWGALAKNSDGSYQVGVRIWELGQHAGVSQREQIVRPYLQDLFDLVHENVHMAVRQGARALYVDKIYGSRKVPMISRVGSKLPLHATAVGRVLLAAEPDWFIKAYLDKKLVAPTEKTLHEGESLRKELRQVSRQGYALTLEQMRLGASSIAVPVIVGTETIASVGIVLESDRAAELMSLLPYLSGTVERIQEALLPIRRKRPKVNIR
ncbi:MAG: HTH-type transcriptional regulator KipR [Actinomycetota bacterium]|jgi:DNA-binding IclR family transcriptional regulator